MFPTGLFADRFFAPRFFPKVGATPATVFGRLEYTMPNERLEYTLSSQRLEYTAANERLEYTVQK